jgi:nucleoside-diphosphate-sugar epimerase
MTGSPATVLVTGGAGYIGSVLVAQLLLEGYRVRVLDNLLFGGHSLLAWLGHRNFDLVIGDVRSVSDIERAVQGADAIVHLAAVVGDPACRMQPELARQVNKVGSELLLEKAHAAEVSRFVFASTCSNYGKMADDEACLDEDSPLRPVSLYAELKVGFENHLLSSGRPGITPVCLRFATAYGLSARPRFDLTVNEFARDLALSRRLEVYGEQFWRPYCHAADLAQACILAIKADNTKVAGRAFNVGENSENYRKKDLIDMILMELPQAADLVSFVTRDEDPRNYRVTFDRIKTQLGFAAARGVRDGIREIIGAVRSGLIKDPLDRMFRNV